MKSKDFLFHEKKYSKELSNHIDFLNHPRNSVLETFEKKFKKLYGNILDIGAGNGYASLYLAQQKNVDNVYSVEISKAGCEVIKKNAKQNSLENKINIVNSNLYDLDFKEKFDFIISFGFLHHANCLYSFYNKIASMQKNFGYLISQEPVMPNTTKNEEYISKYNEKEVKEGIEMFNYERDDHFFREAEYIVAGNFNNYDLVYFDDFNLKKPNLEKNIYPKIMFFKKNINKYIPHKWNVIKD